MKKQLLFLSAQWVRNIIELKDEIHVKDTVAIVGDGTYNGIFFPAEEIEKAYKTMERQPFVLDHSDKVEDEIGYVTDVKFKDGKLVLTPIIIEDTAKAEIAKGFIRSRFSANRLPEVSVGVWATLEEDEDGKKVARNLQFDHLALVTRGACSPSDGCGIGANFEKEEDNMNEEVEEFLEFGVVPRNPKNYAKDANRPWKKPRLQDFTAKSWGELTDAEKRKIASCFAWAEKMPPDTFTQLKLPHHFPGGTLSWNGLRAAMAALLGARGGVDIPNEDKKKVYNHLAKHYKEFDKEPPAFHLEKEVEEDDKMEEIKNEKVEEVEKVEEEFDKEPEPIINPTKTECEKKIEELTKEIEKLTKETEKLKAELAKKDEEIKKLQSKRNSLAVSDKDSNENPDERMFNYLKKLARL